MTTPTGSDLPTAIAGYRIQSILGAGGMSVVYLAQSPSPTRNEALKVLSAELASHPDIRTRFINEATTTAALRHPNIVAIFNRGETTDGQLWFAMEYIAGTDAETALRTNTMTPGRALHITKQVANALDYAHSLGVIHQDIKPANFLLGNQTGQRERVVLSDFGAAITTRQPATITADQPMIASLAYTAPEIFTDRPIDGRADIYALGCTLFRLFTGHYPFPTHTNLADTLNARLQPPPRLSDTLPWATPELDDVIIKALANNPDNRYATAGQFAAAATHAFHTPSTRHPATPPPRPDTLHLNPAKPRPLADASTRTRLITAGAATVVLLAVVALIAWLALPSPTQTLNTATPTTTSAPDDDAARLRHLLPAGYPAGTCTPTTPPDTDATASITCGPNNDPGGPTKAVYALYSDTTALNDALHDVIAAATTQVCPGRIQSPGPWRKLADPSVPQGIVFCATRSTRPTVAWTSDTNHMLARIDGPDLDQLYTWWASHS